MKRYLALLFLLLVVSGMAQVQRVNFTVTNNIRSNGDTIFVTTINGVTDTVYFTADDWTKIVDNISNNNAGDVTLNGQVFVPDIAASGAKYSGNVAGIGNDDRLFPKSITELYGEMQDTIGKVPTAYSTWVRDTTNGEIYQSTLTDKVGIGINAPTAVLHLKLEEDSVKIPVIKFSSGSYLGGIGIDSKLNQAWGLNALSDNTSGTNNIAIGEGALEQNKQGLNNVAIGVDAMRNCGDSTIANIAIGSSTLTNFRIGTTNIAIGIGALNTLDSGACNTAVGSGALQHQTAALDNAAFGSNAGIAITTGDANTAIGTFSMQYSTSAYRNTAVGFHALDSNTTGQYNIAVGAYAGSRIKQITGAVSIGSYASLNQLNTDGDDEPNTSIGFGALRGLDANVNTGNGNNAVGYNALYSS